MHNTAETEVIRRRMEEVRDGLDDSVQKVVTAAHDMANWRSYVKAYPGVCLGVALGAGYWIVRRRPADYPQDAPSVGARQNQLPTALHVPPLGTARGVVLAVAGNLLRRAVSGYVMQHTNRLFKSQVPQPQPNGPS